MGVVDNKILAVGFSSNDLPGGDHEMAMDRIGDTIGRYHMACDGIVLDASAGCCRRITKPDRKLDEILAHAMRGRTPRARVVNTTAPRSRGRSKLGICDSLDAMAVVGDMQVGMFSNKIPNNRVVAEASAGAATKATRPFGSWRWPPRSRPSTNR